jgi:hypothetical protein
MKIKLERKKRILISQHRIKKEANISKKIKLELKRLKIPIILAREKKETSFKAE